MKLDLPQYDVNCLALDDDRVYLGTDNGIYIVERENKRTSRVLHFDEQKGLADDVVTCLEKIGDTLFIGTDYGPDDCLRASRLSSISGSG